MPTTWRYAFSVFMPWTNRVRHMHLFFKKLRYTVQMSGNIYSVRFNWSSNTQSLDPVLLSCQRVVFKMAPLVQASIHSCYLGRPLLNLHRVLRCKQCLNNFTEIFAFSLPILTERIYDLTSFEYWGHRSMHRRIVKYSPSRMIVERVYMGGA